MNEKQDDQYSQDIKGISGWLILVGFGVLYRPINLCSEMWMIYNEVYVSGLMTELGSPESENYQPAFVLIMVMEMLVNTLLLIVSIFLIYLFFSKKLLFPKLLIALFIASPIIVTADSAMLNYFYPGQPIFDAETRRTVLLIAFSAAIWVPYLLVSKRVKATFVNPLWPRNDTEIFS